MKEEDRPLWAAAHDVVTTLEQRGAVHHCQWQVPATDGCVHA